MAKRLLILISLITAFSSCGGGGGGGGGGVAAGKSWNVQAGVSRDTCGERISNVTQTFTIVADDGETIIVDSGMVDLTGANTDSGFSVGFQEGSGDCVRDYVADFTDVSGSNANVTLTSRSTCANSQCESEWIGSATSVN